MMPSVTTVTGGCRAQRYDAVVDVTQTLLALLTTITTVHWADTHRRLARVEQDLSDVKVQLASKPDRIELTAFRADLTQIALAVGAGHPRAGGD